MRISLPISVFTYNVVTKNRRLQRTHKTETAWVQVQPDGFVEALLGIQPVWMFVVAFDRFLSASV